MGGEWRDPLPAPLFASSIAEELIAREREVGEKPHAFDTPFRFSGATDCARKLGLRYAGFEATDPMDGPAQIVVERGTLMHELVQDAIGKRFPGAEFEVKGIIQDLISGSADAYIELNGLRYIWELKNVGAFAFDKAIGLNRKARKRVQPDGPRLSAVVQAGLNALAQEADRVIVAYISNEAISVQLGEQLGFHGLDRIMAEWEIPQEVWYPLARAEVERLQLVRARVDEGWLPVGEAVDDRGQKEWLDPNANYVKWRCLYCSHKSLCKTLPVSNVEISQIRRYDSEAWDEQVR